MLIGGGDVEAALVDVLGEVFDGDADLVGDFFAGFGEGEASAHIESLRFTVHG